MPAKGGAFFGFAIVIAAALITWGIIALVDVANDSGGSGGSGDDDASTRGTGDSEFQVCALWLSSSISSSLLSSLTLIFFASCSFASEGKLLRDATDRWATNGSVGTFTNLRVSDLAYFPRQDRQTALNERVEFLALEH